MSAVIAGVLIAAIGYWIGAVIAFLTMHGIPLGSPGGPPTHVDVSVNLVLAMAASFGGTFATVRIAGHRSTLHALVFGVLLAMSVLAAFANAASNWPAWFPYGMAMACACGAGNVSIDDFVFGVAAIGADGHEGLVRAYVTPERRLPEVKVIK